MSKYDCQTLTGIALLIAVSFAPVTILFVSGRAVANEKPAVALTQAALPAAVEAEIKQTKSEWEAGRSVMKSGFLTERDINGDGVKDYILDYGQFECGESSTIYCGSAGCLAQVFASLPDGSYTQVLNENVRGLKFITLNRRPVMVIDLHGSACGRVGAAPCSMKLFWNGRTFSPAN